ncbi:hypothetical protein QCA50_018631 [Cerrena zonata]|uniref:Uncharacterized protein n=1 Tax=Cerrena zonata TaxID=2478898 RepID=A0AAW0FAR6_9APHY
MEVRKDSTIPKAPSGRTLLTILSNMIINFIAIIVWSIIISIFSIIIFLYSIFVILKLLSIPLVILESSQLARPAQPVTCCH